MSTLEIMFSSGGTAPPGVDLASTREDLRAEVEALASALGDTKVSETTQAGPPGSQGDIQLIQWIVEFAQDPSTVATLLVGGISAMNKIASRLGDPEAEPTEEGTAGSENGDEGDGPSGKKRVKVVVRIAGKRIFLPIAAKAIAKIVTELLLDD